MPNIGSLLRDEITRLSRKSLRSEVGATKKASANHRRQIASLKRQLAQLERQFAQLARRLPTMARVEPEEGGSARVRFVAKGLRSNRERLGLSAAEFGKLVGVSAQSIYNWERETARPRAAQAAKLAALRGLGKKEVKSRLQQLATPRQRVARKKRSRSKS